ncbi:hypothetical protein MLD38_014765 [Melastoma candidum]|uniref:Uncharacterized protein n=1 Tax=Melastoma candidum TaxID=119954 RepID=A0ACB9RDY2_9MYRT|nr:hypothetical protein MLD38_014765 [Melastoma candidum]
MLFGQGTTGFLLLAAAATTFAFLSFPDFSSQSSYHSLFLSPSLSDNYSVANDLRALTIRPHVAGTPANHDAASFVLSSLTSRGFHSRITPYDVLLTYPSSRSLTLSADGKSGAALEVFELRQEVYEGDPYAGVASEVFPTFHGYAKSGTAAAPVVYANYGRVEDFRTLKEMGVEVEGNVVLARYGQIYRGNIVRNAHEAGAIGVVIYTDRKDFGGGGGGARWFPDDKWMPPSGVQVGSVYNGAGDPTTPGWPSVRGCERLTNDEVEKEGDVPLIPSLPVSETDGETILKSLGGQPAKEEWQGSKDAPLYRVGPGPGVLNLTYSGKEIISTIENVIGVIEGSEEPDRYVVLGNHRDAWTFGAVDPNSGTAALLEVAKRLNKLQQRGWRPRRTIIFCNWDAEEYGLLGSTEWVEENRQLLSSRAVAYLNVDCAVSGPGFHVASTPQLDEIIRLAAQQVQDPDNSSQTVYDSWKGTGGGIPVVDRLGGAGSDYSAFIQHIGVPAADIFYGGGYPVYHSMYDDFVWMEKFGDPGFRRHVAVASFWGLVALRLADDEILPFDYTSYAADLKKNVQELKEYIAKKEVDLIPLDKAVEEFTRAAAQVNTEIMAIKESKPWLFKRKEYHSKVKEINDRLMMAERAFTDPDGLFDRKWYKHLIYAPSKHDDYGSKSFPGVGDAIEEAKEAGTAESWHTVQHEIWRVSRAVKHAALVLSGGLT